MDELQLRLEVMKVAVALSGVNHSGNALNAAEQLMRWITKHGELKPALAKQEPR